MKFVHATGKGITETDLTSAVCTFMPELKQNDFPWVYRPKNASIGRDAAETAVLWSKPGVSGSMSYTIGGATAAVFRSSAFGSGAKARAQSYRYARMTRGGPAKSLGAPSSTFCSALVAACYQAVVPEAKTQIIMGVDAINTLPVTLQNWIANSSNWTYQGRVVV